MNASGVATCYAALQPSSIRPGGFSFITQSGSFSLTVGYAVTRAGVDANLEAARSLFGDTLRVFCIDEGWETQWGTWEPNAKFAGGSTSAGGAAVERGTRTSPEAKPTSHAVITSRPAKASTKRLPSIACFNACPRPVG